MLIAAEWPIYGRYGYGMATEAAGIVRRRAGGQVPRARDRWARSRWSMQRRSPSWPHRSSTGTGSPRRARSNARRARWRDLTGIDPHPAVTTRRRGCAWSTAMPSGDGRRLRRVRPAQQVGAQPSASAGAGGRADRDARPPRGSTSGGTCARSTGSARCMPACARSTRTSGRISSTGGRRARSTATTTCGCGCSTFPARSQAAATRCRRTPCSTSATRTSTAAVAFVLDGGRHRGRVHAARIASRTCPLDIDVLGGAYLGGGRRALVALAGRVDEHTPGAVAALDRALRTARAPWATTNF